MTLPYEFGSFLPSLLFRRFYSTASCIVSAFGSRGRLVIQDSDASDAKGSDATIFIIDAAEGGGGAAGATSWLRHIGAHASDDAPPSLLVLAGVDTPSSESHIWLTLKALQLEALVAEAGCEVLAVGPCVANGVAHLVQLLVWRLLRQSS